MATTWKARILQRLNSDQSIKRSHDLWKIYPSFLLGPSDLIQKRKKINKACSDFITFCLFRHKSIMWFYCHWFRTHTHTRVRLKPHKIDLCNYRRGLEGTTFLSPINIKQDCFLKFSIHQQHIYFVTLRGMNHHHSSQCNHLNLRLRSFTSAQKHYLNINSRLSY